VQPTDMSDHTEQLPVALGSYSQFRWAGDTLYIAGQVGVDPANNRTIRGYEDLSPEVAAKMATGKMSIDSKEAPIAAQTWWVFHTIQTILEQEGASLQNVVRLVQYMRDLRDFPVFDRVRAMFFPQNPPASTVVQVSELLPTPESRIEVDATAYVPGRSARGDGR
jgi:enamine deaminase RidA (YjgF/YER057c/UK114 family)